MRVIQLIDSLEAGGAERMSVNIANALSKKIDKSFLCATRKEGVLKESLNDRVGYVFLNKQFRIDIRAIYKLNKFVKKHSIKFIHAHSTSFFLATLIKFINKDIVIIWHDHYGNSENLKNRKIKSLQFSSKYFAHIISVNTILRTWAKNNLKTESISYLPNFANDDKLKPETILKGEEGKRILHLANLRPQKDHETAFRAFFNIIKKHPEWTLHCVGKDFNNVYSNSINDMIKDLGLTNHVFLYGSKSDVKYIISQCEIGILSSKSEGLPIALLEYGLSKLPVVVTNVGDCKKVVSNFKEGILVNPEDHKALSKAILKLIEDVDLRKVIAKNLHQKVVVSFSESSSIETLINIYKQYQE